VDDFKRYLPIKIFGESQSVGSDSSDFYPATEPITSSTCGVDIPRPLVPRYRMARIRWISKKPQSLGVENSNTSNRLNPDFYF
jgi:hypothetical protein